ncbi:MAG: hypothetical protein VKL42_22215 [Snowella sp.]|nr:hypothetical protein [Snowella sp.]
MAATLTLMGGTVQNGFQIANNQENEINLQAISFAKRENNNSGLALSKINNLSSRNANSVISFRSIIDSLAQLQFQPYDPNAPVNIPLLPQTTYQDLYQGVYSFSPQTSAIAPTIIDALIIPASQTNPLLITPSAILDVPSPVTPNALVTTTVLAPIVITPAISPTTPNPFTPVVTVPLLTSSLGRTQSAPLLTALPSLPYRLTPGRSPSMPTESNLPQALQTYLMDNLGNLERILGSQVKVDFQLEPGQMQLLPSSRPLLPNHSSISLNNRYSPPSSSLSPILAPTQPIIQRQLSEQQQLLQNTLQQQSQFQEQRLQQERQVLSEQLGQQNQQIMQKQLEEQRNQQTRLQQQLQDQQKQAENAKKELEKSLRREQQLRLN